MTSARTLDQLLGAGGATTVTGITNDSRRVSRGDLFLACAGETDDGHRHVKDAIGRGAAAVCSERPVAACVPNVVISDLGTRQGEIAARYFGDPSAALTCIGVTGTNGKTSVAYQCASLLDDAAYMGTIGWGHISRLCRSRLTTEDAVTVQRRLGAVRGDGHRRVAMEVSSHALAQERVSAVHFDIAVLTNLTRDHLDYHGTMERYGAAKRRLFEMPSLGTVVVNLDDDFGRSLLADLEVEAIGYGQSPDAAVSWSDVGFHPHGIRGRWHTPWGDSRFWLPLYGEFSLYNAAATLSAVCVAGKPLRETVAEMRCMVPVPGRMQRVASSNCSRPTVFVDYAHTPAALSAALAAVRQHLGGRLTCVFGCGGDRDPGKRPMMAKAVEAGADAAIVTSDNPRTENPDAIIADIVRGFTSRGFHTVEPDRTTAVKLAIERAKPGEVVLVAGKGHEDFQDIAGQRIPYSDLRIAQAVLDVEPSAGEREGFTPRKKEPSAGEREGFTPRRKEPSAGEREGFTPRRKEPSAPGARGRPSQESVREGEPLADKGAH